MDKLWLNVENANREIACFEQFLHVFKKLSAAEVSESVYMRERVKKEYLTSDRQK